MSPQHPAGPPAPPLTAAFFDVDETLVTVKTMFRFLEYHWHRTGRPASDFHQTRAQFAALPARGVPRAEANRLFYGLFAGQDAEQLSAHGRDWFAAELTDPGFWNPSGVAALRRHAAAGDLVVLVSGSFPPCLDPLAAHLGVDTVLCSRPQIVEGRYTGLLDTPMIGATKGAAAQALMASLGLDPAQCYAYGDHVSDLPLLEQVGHPVVVGDAPDMLEHAQRPGWSRLAA